MREASALFKDIKNIIIGNHMNELFNTGPYAIYGAFNTYEEVWFLNKKTVKITQNVVETNFLLKSIIRYIFSQLVIFL